MNSDEAFIVNSLVEIMPICEVDENPIGDEGKACPVSMKLLKAYRERVKKETS